MKKFTPVSLLAALAILLLATACSKKDADKEASAADSAAATETAVLTYEGQGSIMDAPVDFSSPENVEMTLDLIRATVGEREAGSIKNAMDYMLFYDLALGKDKNKLYKKLDGKTPNEILAIPAR